MPVEQSAGPNSSLRELALWQVDAGAAKDQLQLLIRSTIPGTAPTTHIALKRGLQKLQLVTTAASKVLLWQMMSSDSGHRLVSEQPQLHAHADFKQRVSLP